MVKTNSDKEPTYLEVQLHTSNAGDLYRIGKLVASANGAPLSFRANKRHRNNERYQKWNDIEIEVRGEHVAVKVNELLQSEAIVKSEPGHIALRNESSVIEYRNIRLVPLEAPMLAHVPDERPKADPAGDTTKDVAINTSKDNVPTNKQPEPNH